jgi:hypothetical protein
MTDEIRPTILSLLAQMSAKLSGTREANDFNAVNSKFSK